VYSGVSYLLPSEAELLLEAVEKNHEAQKARSSLGEIKLQSAATVPVIDEKHRQFIDDVVSVSALTAHW